MPQTTSRRLPGNVAGHWGHRWTGNDKQLSSLYISVLHNLHEKSSSLNTPTSFGVTCQEFWSVTTRSHLSIKTQEIFLVPGKSDFGDGAAPENVTGRNDGLEACFLVSWFGKELFTLTYWWNFQRLYKKHMWTELEGVFFFPVCVHACVLVCLEHTAWLSESMSGTICHHCILSLICRCLEVRSNLSALLPSKLIFYHHKPPVSLIDYFSPTILCLI